MMEIIKILKTSSLGPWLVAALCVLVLTAAMPQTASATAVEYAVMLALILVTCITDVSASGLPQDGAALNAITAQFQTAANAAALANSEGDRAKEISRLGKTLGAAEALMGMTSSCDTCDDLRTHLQQIIGLAALLKSRALGVGGACNPDGVIQGGEQCDPLAVPTGCPVLTVPSFCSDECQCEIVIP
jgi:Flp pilus assembly pilin Flp